MDDTYTCPICFREFEALFSFHRHTREAHPETANKRPVIDRTCNGSEVPELQTCPVLQNAEL